MGWKTSVIIASQLERPILSDKVVHNPERADQLAAKLPGDFAFVGSSTFEEGAYPSNGNLYIGAYVDSLILGHMDFGSSCFEGDVPAVIHTVAAFLPRSTILALQLHSVVNLYGYALFENGQLIRRRAGSADDGVFLDSGEPVAEEQPLFAMATINSDGEQVWPETYDGVVEEMDHSSMGEEFVFEISKRFFGERFDEFDHDSLPMSEYQARPKTLWQRLLGK